ncbi:hypothetical protein KFL_001060050 [Klebsormidium nitens]|uniref:Uncharacterized protein n=1 Tax=Klebsormidium nitens TaxID=105231 RepID=A0A1Y1HVS8_KLENI|nr:hypothetical protein KFL_001060050 [Klebsormidium nitens]|eukprot:GAQ82273.1 hypothetical protein KFL_001060050 [Klebsormidium nitens]
MSGQQNLVKKVALCRASGSSAVSAEVSKPAASVLPGWGAFCDKVSGEWEGYEVTFTSASGSSWGECTAVELPYAVVPDAFREWEIRLFDWQTQCSSYGSKEDGTVLFKLARLLPTVGCEADAATVHTVDEKTADGRESSGPIAFLPDGSYSLSWPTASAEGGQKWQVEHGLVDSSGLRIRVTLTLERPSMSAQPALTSVKVARERWDSAFEKGESLSSCGGKMRGFADDPRLVKTTIEGAWSADQHIFTPTSKGFDVVNKTVEVDRKLRESDVNVLLPAGVWVKVGEAEGGGFAVLASWVQGEETGTSAERVYGHDGALQKVILTKETRR